MERTWLIKLFEFGSTKSQRQINAANPDVRNKIKTLSAFLLCQTHISLFPTAHSIFPSSWLNIFFLQNNFLGLNGKKGMYIHMLFPHKKISFLWPPPPNGNFNKSVWMANSKKAPWLVNSNKASWLVNSNKASWLANFDQALLLANFSRAPWLVNFIKAHPIG